MARVLFSRSWVTYGSAAVQGAASIARWRPTALSSGDGLSAAHALRKPVWPSRDGWRQPGAGRSIRPADPGTVQRQRLDATLRIGGL